MSRSIIKAVAIATLSVCGLVVAYLGAAIVGTVWVADGIRGGNPSHTIHILSNGFHSDIAIPVVDGRIPEGLPIDANDFPGDLTDTRYLIVGWGSETAYTSLMVLSDMTARIAVKALAFDRSVMHVQPYSGTLAGDGIYALQLGDAQYRALLEFISRTFAVSESGKSPVLAGVTQGFGDIFYAGRPRFSLFYGCNAWTGEALRTAGVPVGIWTPFAQSVEWNMARIAAADATR